METGELLVLNCESDNPVSNKNIKDDIWEIIDE